MHQIILSRMHITFLHYAPAWRINDRLVELELLVILTAATGMRISTNRPASACLISLSFTSRKYWAHSCLTKHTFNQLHANLSTNLGETCIISVTKTQAPLCMSYNARTRRIWVPTKYSISCGSWLNKKISGLRRLLNATYWVQDLTACNRFLM